MESEEEHGARHRAQAFIHKWVPAKYIHAAEHYGHVVYLTFVAVFAHGPYAFAAGCCAAVAVFAIVAGYSEEA